MKKALFLFFFFSLSADEDTNALTVSNGGLPSVNVEGCVNAITGNLVIRRQFIQVSGAVPITITGFYSSTQATKPEGGWDIFSDVYAHGKYNGNIITLSSRKGVPLTFISGSGKKEYKLAVLKK